MTAAHCRQVFALVVFALATALLSAAAVSAQNDPTRTLTILAARCPSGYMGNASADECDNAPMPGVTFHAGRPYTDFYIMASTDETGIVVFDFTGLPYNGTLRVIEELPPETARFVAYCVNEAGSPLRITYEDFPQAVPPIGVAAVAVGDTGNVRCDWYNVPVP